MRDNVLTCDICGTDSTKAIIKVHSAINMPISLSYCECCDKKGFITTYELIRFMSNPKNKQWIIENVDFIIDNCQVIENSFRRRRFNNKNNEE